MVDSSSEIVLDRARYEKFPECVVTGSLMEFAEDVHQSPFHDFFEPRKLVRMVAHFAEMPRIIENVIRSRCDVDVSHPNQVFVVFMRFIQVLPKSLQPAKLVRKLLGAQLLPFGT